VETTQCAAVSTHLPWISVPPQKAKPELVLKLTCQGHSQGVAGCPFTIEGVTESIELLTPQGVMSGPLTPQVPGTGLGEGVGGSVVVVAGAGASVVDTIGMSVAVSGHNRHPRLDHWLLETHSAVWTHAP